jgi:SAM-dependent methyltransferase
MTGLLDRDYRASAGKGAALELLHAACPVCGRDEGEPVAVGSDAAGGTQDSFLAVSCLACGLFYLNPRPAASEWTRLYPPTWFRSAHATHRGRTAAVRRLARQLGATSPTARVLEIGYGATLHLEAFRGSAPRAWELEAVTPHEELAHTARALGFTVHPGSARALDAPAGGYDLILLLYSLEHSDSPVAEMAVVHRLLRVGGRALILTPNADSTVGILFRGRHWAGYDFPRHRCLFGPRALRQLAETSGFQVERLGSHQDPSAWVRSAENWLRDWGAPSWLTSTAPKVLALGGLASSLALRTQRQSMGSELEAIFLKVTSP